jgi:uncharacterized membrane protein
MPITSIGYIIERCASKREATRIFASPTVNYNTCSFRYRLVALIPTAIESVTRLAKGSESVNLH